LFNQRKLPRPWGNSKAVSSMPNSNFDKFSSSAILDLMTCLVNSWRFTYCCFNCVLFFCCNTQLRVLSCYLRFDCLQANGFCAWFPDCSSSGCNCGRTCNGVLVSDVYWVVFASEGGVVKSGVVSVVVELDLRGSDDFCWVSDRFFSHQLIWKWK
jgi:hypothetical protein